MKLLFIGLGGALGAVSRYLLSGWVYKVLGTGFPWGTLAVNSLGSFLMGVLWGVFDVCVVPQNTRVFLLVGCLGAFTTFSTFSFENFQLIRDGQTNLALLNCCISVIISLGMVFCGFFAARFLLSVMR